VLGFYGENPDEAIAIVNAIVNNIREDTPY